MYSEKSKVFARNLLAQAYCLCYVLEANMKAASKVLHDQAVADDAIFGNELMVYLPITEHVEMELH